MNAHNTIDRTGQKFNNWSIISYSHTGDYRKRYYLCRCDCGFEITKPVGRVVNGSSKSCGCENAKNHITHNYSRKRVYRIWVGIKSRCLNPNCTQYKWYGGRGIKICDRWVNSFDNFFNDVGEPPTQKHSIDRYPDNNGEYHPNNFRWATAKEQAKNRRKPSRTT